MLVDKNASILNHPSKVRPISNHTPQENIATMKENVKK
ncbi:hypothetical protein RV13_GL000147 [Enterococcus raffinosus]|nr:hypothetical protein RV13_GL000147 [Enterococcus raffinosus]